MEHLEYNVVAQYTTRIRSMSMDDIDDVMDALLGYHVSAAASDLGRLQVTITLPAENLAQATRTGLAVLADAIGDRHEVLAVEVLPTREFDRRSGIDYVPPIVGVTEAALIMGVSRQRVLQLVESGSLPHTRAGRAVVIPRVAVEKRAKPDRATDDEDV